MMKRALGGITVQRFRLAIIGFLGGVHGCLLI
jgi:hypothetical protein